MKYYNPLVTPFFYYTYTLHPIPLICTVCIALLIFGHASSLQADTYNDTDIAYLQSPIYGNPNLEFQITQTGTYTGNIIDNVNLTDPTDLTKSGKGTLILNYTSVPASTFTGGTDIQNGILQVNIGAKKTVTEGTILGTGNIYIEETGTLAFNNKSRIGQADSGSLVTNIFRNNVRGSGTVIFGLASDKNYIGHEISVAIGGDNLASGDVAGDWSNFTGNVQVRNVKDANGALQLVVKCVDNTPNAKRYEFDGSRATWSLVDSGTTYGSTMTIERVDTNTGSVTTKLGALEGAGTLRNSSNMPTSCSSIVILGYANRDSVFSGALGRYTKDTKNNSNGFSLVKVGSGTQTLSGKSYYTGDTTISAGVLRTEHEDALGGNTALLTIENGASLQTTTRIKKYEIQAAGLGMVGSDGLYLGAINFDGTSAGADSFGNTITLMTSESVNSSGIGVTAGNVAKLSGVIQESGGTHRLFKYGEGTLILTGVNTYTGNTIVNAGILEIAENGTLGTTSPSSYATVRNNATLKLSNQTSLNTFHIEGMGATDSDGNHLGALLFNQTGTFNEKIIMNADASVGVTADNTVTLTGVISNVNLNTRFTKSSEGTLVLTNANTFSGHATVDGGVLAVQHSQALGSSHTVKVEKTNDLSSAGGTLRLDVNPTQNTFYIEGSGHNNTGAVLFNMTGTFNQDIILTDEAYIGVTANNTATYTGTISDEGLNFGFVKVGDGELVIQSTTSTYSGPTGIKEGTLTITSAGNLGNTSEVLAFSGGRLNVIGNVDTPRNMTFVGDNSRISVADGYLLKLTGSMSDSALGSGGFTKDGTGNLDITEVTSTFSGQTTISEGTLSVGEKSLQNSYVSVASGATLSVNSDNLTLGGLHGDSDIAISGTAGDITLTLNVSEMNSPNYGGTLSNPTGGTLTLIKTGKGKQTLSGTNTFTGSTTIKDGTLSITSADNLKNTSEIFMEGPGILESTATLTLNKNITLTNAPDMPGFTTINTPAANTLTLAGIIAGNGGFIKRGDGTLILAGSNTFTGDIEIRQGTFTISGNDNLGTGNGTIILSGGTLEVTESTDTKPLESNMIFNDDVSNISIDAGKTVAVTSSVSLTGAGGFHKIGAGTLDLSPITATTFTGVTHVDEGVLIIGARTLEKSAVSLGAGTLTLNAIAGNELYLGGLDGSSNVPFTFTSTTASDVTLVLNVDAANSPVYTSAIANPDDTHTLSLKKTGAGMQTLAAANTYTGTTLVQEGILKITDSRAVRADETGQTLTVENGATLMLAVQINQNAGDTYDPVYLTLAGNGALDQDGKRLGAVSFDFNHPDATSAVTHYIITDDTGFGVTRGSDPTKINNVYFNGGITNRSGKAHPTLTKFDDGILTINRASADGNTNVYGLVIAEGMIDVTDAAGLQFVYDGQITVRNGGTLRLGKAPRAPGTAETYSDYTYTIEGHGTTDLAGNNRGALLLADSSVQGELSDHIVLSGNASIGVDSGVTAIHSGSITDDGNSYGIMKLGVGYLKVTSTTNTYSGATGFAAGTLEISSAQNLGSTNQLDFSGGKLFLNGTGSALEPNVATFNTPATFDQSSEIEVAENNRMEITGGSSDAPGTEGGGFTKTGAGTLLLSGNTQTGSAHSGATIINAGLLRADSFALKNSRVDINTTTLGTGLDATGNTLVTGGINAGDPSSTFGESAQLLTFSNATDDVTVTFDVAQGVTTNMNSPLKDPEGHKLNIVKKGAGTQKILYAESTQAAESQGTYVTAGNDMTGTTTIEEGTIIINNRFALGLYVENTVSIAEGASLQFENNDWQIGRYNDRSGDTSLSFRNAIKGSGIVESIGKKRVYLGGNLAEFTGELHAHHVEDAAADNGVNLVPSNFDESGNPVFDARGTAICIDAGTQVVIESAVSNVTNGAEEVHSVAWIGSLTGGGTIRDTKTNDSISIIKVGFRNEDNVFDGIIGSVTTKNVTNAGSTIALEKVGSAKLTLTNDKSYYIGATTVSEGALIINGVSGTRGADVDETTAAVTVNANALLGGTGVIKGMTTVEENASITGGEDGTVGTLRFVEDVEMAGNWIVDINDIDGSDMLAITSADAVFKPTSRLILQLAGVTPELGSVYTIMTTTKGTDARGVDNAGGTITPEGFTDWNYLLSNEDRAKWSLSLLSNPDQTQQRLVLSRSVQQIPEPGTFTLFTGLFLGLYLLARKYKKASSRS